MGCNCRGNSVKPAPPQPVIKPNVAGGGAPGTPVANPRTVQTTRRTIIRRG